MHETRASAFRTAPPVLAVSEVLSRCSRSCRRDILNIPSLDAWDRSPAIPGRSFRALSDNSVPIRRPRRLFPRKFNSAAFISPALVQVMQWGPPLITTTSRASVPTWPKISAKIWLELMCPRWSITATTIALFPFQWQGSEPPRSSKGLSWCWRCAGSSVPTALDLITNGLTFRLAINLVRWPSLEVSSNRSARLLVFP